MLACRKNSADSVGGVLILHRANELCSHGHRPMCQHRTDVVGCDHHLQFLFASHVTQRLRCNRRGEVKGFLERCLGILEMVEHSCPVMKVAGVATVDDLAIKDAEGIHVPFDTVFLAPDQSLFAECNEAFWATPGMKFVE